EVIYKRRKNALFGERLNVDIANMTFDTVSGIVQESLEFKDFENFKLELIRHLSMESPLDEQAFFSINPDELTEKVYQAALINYKQKSQMVAQTAYPVIKQVFEDETSNFENIVVPFSDGKKNIQVVTPLQKAYETRSEEHTSELQSRENLVCRLLLEKKKTQR